MFCLPPPPPPLWANEIGNGKWTQTFFFLKPFGRLGISRQNPGICRSYREINQHLSLLGACARTTKFLDYIICTFKMLLSWRFPHKKSSVFDDSPPPQKFDFPGFEGRIEFFGPHPFTWKTPTPLGNIRTKKFGFGFLSERERERQKYRALP